MAKAAGPPKSKQKPKLTDKEQSERFIATARELAVDESGKAFELAFTKIVPAKQEVAVGMDDYAGHN
jgi:hypothetical protein